MILYRYGRQYHGKVLEISWKYPGNIQDVKIPNPQTPIKRRRNMIVYQAQPWSRLREEEGTGPSQENRRNMSASSDDKHPSRVLEHLYIGSRAHAKNRGLLKELGINRILNVTPPRT